MPITVLGIEVGKNTVVGLLFAKDTPYTHSSTNPSLDTR